MAPGLSVVICCFNGETRLPHVLAHLAVQEVPGDLAWEVILVDNGSTDRTACVGRSCWKHPAVPLRIVAEERRGLSWARKRGVDEARYEIVSFVDDDNWVSPDWVTVTCEVMGHHPEAGACGGRALSVLEHERPSWFDEFGGHYAVGTQAEAAGDVTESRGYLWGAGLAVRRRAWLDLFEQGFDFLLEDRRGSALSAGGDSELCHALRLAGWRLLYEPRLTFQHYLPASRLQWAHLRRMNRGFGRASVILEAYDHVILEREVHAIHDSSPSWWKQSSETLLGAVRRGATLLRSWLDPMVGHPDAIWAEYTVGRLQGLAAWARDYDRAVDRIRHITPAAALGRCDRGRS